MSYTEGYLEFLHEQATKRRGLSWNELGPQKSKGVKTFSTGSKYKIVKHDIDTLARYIKRKSGRGPGKVNHSVIIYGRPGVGKSAIIKKVAMELASDLGREFVDFNAAYSKSKEDLYDIFNNPKKYYCFIDIRAGMYEAYEFKGIPKPSEKIEGTSDSLDMLWIKILTIPDSAGLLFLDEINQADPSTQNAMYPLLHHEERSLAERGITNAAYWSVHAAGNLGAKFQGTTDLNKALVNRVSTVYFEITFPKWLQFAENYTEEVNGEERNVYHPFILQFLKFIADSYPDKLQRFFADEDETNVTTGDPNPRNFAKLSQSIYGLEDAVISGEVDKSDFIDLVEAEAGADINTVWMDEFIYFLRRLPQSNIDAMLKEPEKHFVMQKKKGEPGVEPKIFFINLSLFQDRINAFMIEYLDSSNYMKYFDYKNNLQADQAENKLPTPNPDADIPALNKIAISFFKVIETMANAEQSHNGAIIYSYLRDCMIKGQRAWPIFQVAFGENASPADSKAISSFLALAKQKLEKQIADAKAALRSMAAVSSKQASKSIDDEDEEMEDEEGDIKLNVAVANNELEKALETVDGVYRQVASRVPELADTFNKSA